MLPLLSTLGRRIFLTLNTGPHLELNPLTNTSNKTSSHPMPISLKSSSSSPLPWSLSITKSVHSSTNRRLQPSKTSARSSPPVLEKSPLLLSAMLRITLVRSNISWTLRGATDATHDKQGFHLGTGFCKFLTKGIKWSHRSSISNGTSWYVNNFSVPFSLFYLPFFLHLLFFPFFCFFSPFFSTVCGFGLCLDLTKHC